MNFLINKLNRTWSISHVDQTVLIAFTRRPTKAQTQFFQAYESNNKSNLFTVKHFEIQSQSGSHSHDRLVTFGIVIIYR